jgi:hypothetical protein
MTARQGIKQQETGLAAGAAVPSAGFVQRALDVRSTLKGATHGTCTIVGLNDAKAVKKWSGFLAVDVGRSAYFSKKYYGVRRRPRRSHRRCLSSWKATRGSRWLNDLSMQLKGEGIEGGDVLEGTEEDLKLNADQLYIDQLRHG